MKHDDLLSYKLAMAKRHQADGRFGKATQLYEQVLSSDSESIDASYSLASLYLSQKRDGAAKPLLEKIVNRDPKHFDARLKLAEVMHDAGETDKKLKLLQSIEELADGVNRQTSLAATLQRLGMLKQAAEIYLRMLENNPEFYRAHANLGTIYRDIGQFDLAAEHCRHALDIYPNCAHAYYTLAFLDQIDPRSKEFSRLEALSRQVDALDVTHQMYLNYALGKVYEKAGQYDSAFNRYLEANRCAKALAPYSQNTTQKRFSGIKSVFDRDFFLKNPKVGSTSRCPIFILGMPRSGTTLVEQILSSHPLVFGAGELNDFSAFAFRIQALTRKPFFYNLESVGSEHFQNAAKRYLSKIKALSNNAEHVTDKMPQNFLYIGLITLLFPNAKILHCRRNPLDTCLSIFTNNLSGAHPYSHSLDDLGRYYQEYADLMRHWHYTLPFRIYDVQYEDLVADTHSEIEAILSFCELPADPACLEFHKTERVVATASATQVRQPIYKKSISRWKHFEKHLQPLIDIFNEQH